LPKNIENDTIFFKNPVFLRQLKDILEAFYKITERISIKIVLSE
jgi:hypothetical protein